MSDNNEASAYVEQNSVVRVGVMADYREIYNEIR
jgi:hypothetical protein